MPDVFKNALELAKKELDLARRDFEARREKMNEFSKKMNKFARVANEARQLYKQKDRVHSDINALCEQRILNPKGNSADLLYEELLALLGKEEKDETQRSQYVEKERQRKKLLRTQIKEYLEREKNSAAAAAAAALAERITNLHKRKAAQRTKKRTNNARYVGINL
jgi:hypothetical protein